jgi:Arc/MetJ-type ribon-helix-helix transcriptional regulator
LFFDIWKNLSLANLAIHSQSLPKYNFNAIIIMYKNNYLKPMVTLNISLNDELADIVTKEMKDKKFANRSEFFRDLLRKEYVYKNQDVVIEEIGPDDEDYKIIQKRKKNAEFISEEEFFKR